jgi:hypothetical protein
VNLPPEVVAADHALSPHRQRSALPPLTEAQRAHDQRVVAKMKRRETERLARQAQAASALRAWAEAHAARDQVIRAAHDAGLGVREIHRITGVARTTIDRILAG